ncbi:MAG: hydrolase [Firmicutes bacterium]|nr:hydrolase [Bacillota bacterium]
MTLKVTAALLIKSGKVLIAKKTPQDKRANQWEFPGGKIDLGETPEECLIRELREEFNIRITVDSLFTESLYTHSAGQILVMAYFCTWTSGTLQLTEHATYRWVYPTELSGYDIVASDAPIANKLRNEYPSGYIPAH